VRSWPVERSSRSIYPGNSTRHSDRARRVSAARNQPAYRSALRRFVHVLRCHRLLKVLRSRVVFFVSAFDESVCRFFHDLKEERSILRRQLVVHVLDGSLGLCARGAPECWFSLCCNHDGSLGIATARQTSCSMPLSTSSGECFANLSASSTLISPKTFAIARAAGGCVTSSVPAQAEPRRNRPRDE
jgi:hypothetical protein